MYLLWAECGWRLLLHAVWLALHGQYRSKSVPEFRVPASAQARVRSDVSYRVQVRYQQGVQDMLDKWFKGEPFPEQNYIVRDGELASQYS